MAERNTVATKESTDVAKTEPTWGGTYYTPRVDVYEDENELVFLCDMPGVKPDQIDLRFENGELTLHGHAEPRQNNPNYRLWEYGVGDFYRSFNVGAEFDAGRISAEYKLGVLTVRLPKREEIKPRRIQIRAE
jgi:HSP20 family protein